MGVLIVILIVAVVAAGIWLSYYLKKRRRDELGVFAKQYGLSYSQADPYDLLGYDFKLLRQGDGRGCENVLAAHLIMCSTSASSSPPKAATTSRWTTCASLICPWRCWLNFAAPPAETIRRAALLPIGITRTHISIRLFPTEPPPAAVTTNGPIFLRKTMMFSVTSSIDSRILTPHGC